MVSSCGGQIIIFVPKLGELGPIDVPLPTIPLVTQSSSRSPYLLSPARFDDSLIDENVFPSMEYLQQSRAGFNSSCIAFTVVLPQ